MDGATAVRTIERWGLLAGVAGIVANLLLVALYALALPGVGDFAWTGPANDVVGGIVAMGATIPVAVALASVLHDRLVRWATPPAVVAMATMVVTSALLVADVIPFETQVFAAIPVIVVVFGWTAVIGRAGGRTRRLSPRLARSATAVGLAWVAGVVIALPSLLLPAQSVAQYVVGGIGLVVGVPAYLAFPVWLVALSSRAGAQLPSNEPSTGDHDENRVPSAGIPDSGRRRGPGGKRRPGLLHGPARDGQR